MVKIGIGILTIFALTGCMKGPAPLDTLILAKSGDNAAIEHKNVGKASGNTPVTFYIFVEADAGLATAALAASDPTKPGYGKSLLGYGDVLKKVPNAQKQLDDIQTNLLDASKGGFETSEVTKGLLSITVSSTADKVAKYLNTSGMSNYKDPATGNVYAAFDDEFVPALPAGLEGLGASHLVWPTVGQSRPSVQTAAAAQIEMQDTTVVITPNTNLMNNIVDLDNILSFDSNPSDANREAYSVATLSDKLVGIRDYYGVDSSNPYSVGVVGYMGDKFSTDYFTQFKNDFALKNPMPICLTADPKKGLTSAACSKVGSTMEGDTDAQWAAALDDQAQVYYVTPADGISTGYISLSTLLVGIERSTQGGETYPKGYPKVFSMSYTEPAGFIGTGNIPAYGCTLTGDTPQYDCAAQKIIEGWYDQINALNLMGFTFLSSSGDAGSGRNIMNNPAAGSPFIPTAYQGVDDNGSSVWSDIQGLFPNFAGQVGENKVFEKQYSLLIEQLGDDGKTTNSCLFPQMVPIAGAPAITEKDGKKLKSPIAAAPVGACGALLVAGTEEGEFSTCGCGSLIAASTSAKGRLFSGKGSSGSLTGTQRGSVLWEAIYTPGIAGSLFYPLGILPGDVWSASPTACDGVKGSGNQCNFSIVDTLTPELYAEKFSADFPVEAFGFVTQTSIPNVLPNVTSVGGTMLSTHKLKGNVTSGQAKDGIVEAIASPVNGSTITSGGGFSYLVNNSQEVDHSSFEDKPFVGAYDFQTQAVQKNYIGANWYNDTMQNSGEVLSSADKTVIKDSVGFYPKGRAYPDVALVGHNVPIFTDIALPPAASEVGGYMIGSGTSVSSPVFASMLAKLSADLGISLGNANQLIYAIYDAQGDDGTDPAFVDIQSPGNKSGTHCGYAGDLCKRHGFYVTKGWDAATGVGSPRYPAFKAAACKLPGLAGLAACAN